MATSLRVYFDMCALKRGWDDPAQVRVRLEAAAVDAVLRMAAWSRVTLIHSTIHDIENASNTDRDRRVTVARVLSHYPIEPFDHDALDARSKAFATAGLRAADASHLAAALVFGADRLVTTDDRFLRRATRLTAGISGNRLRVVGPIELASEVLE